MISDKMVELSMGNSAIRAMFEEGAKLKEQYGANNVFDFSLGNPSVAPPKAVMDAIIDIVQNEPPMLVHGYMANAGYKDVREVVAASTNRAFGTDYSAENIVMTVGAAGAINVIFRTLLNPGDEVVVFAPYFGEYNNYTKSYGGTVKAVAPNTETFQPDMAAFEAAVTSKTKAVIINSPNNPSGAVYSEETLREIADILQQAMKKYGNPIYLISDEPYRKLAYSGVVVPFPAHFYPNTLMVYSFSKSLSIPGERIGYLIAPKELDGFDEIMGALITANRVLGYVNAPSLMQRVAARCIDVTVDTTPYEKNMEALHQKLIALGFECFKPQGAFYLFPRALEVDDKAFCARAKQYNILVVPGTSFGCPGFFRLAYCTSYETVLNSLPAFEKLAAAYQRP